MPNSLIIELPMTASFTPPNEDFPRRSPARFITSAETLAEIIGFPSNADGEGDKSKIDRCWQVQAGVGGFITYAYKQMDCSSTEPLSWSLRGTDQLTVAAFVKLLVSNGINVQMGDD